VGLEISMSAAGTCHVYHGTVLATATTAGKVIGGGYFQASDGRCNNMGDWGPQVAAANEAISADVVGGTAEIILHYMKLE
jgi:hypothetical protein